MFPSSENKINLSQTALLNKGQRFHSTATQTDIVLGITTVQAAQFPIFHSKKTEPQEWSEWLKPPMTHRHMSLVPNDMNDQRAEVAAEVTHAAVKAVPQINVEIDAIRQAQETDAVIGPVYRAFQKGVKPNVDQVGGETKALLRWWEELSLLGGRLMIKMKHRHGKYSVQHEGRIKAYVESTESRQKDRALAATPPVSSDTSPPTVTETPPPTKPSQDSVTNGFFTEEEDDVEMLSVTPPLPEDPAIARPTGALPDAEPDVDVDNRADVEPETDRLPPTSSMKELAKEESVDVNQEDDDHPQEGDSAAIEELETCGEEIYSADHGFRSSRQRRKPVRFGDYHLDRVHSWSKSNYTNRVVPKKSETQTILHADGFSNYHEEFPALVEAANPIKGLKKGPIPGRNSISGGDGVVNNILRAIEQYTLLQVDGPE
ncbi:hypothetical protein EB796_015242 [Bugula neritina]|uniref:Uncharacterized protein n=1 Tax=Bugula neritina TaxID=10212 RepID=A0A7J7JLB1_BUGNE|nr:hypothetical protein EB796_015242 [Bugula neritina]